MERRIGVEIDPHRTSKRVVVESDREVFDRSERKIVRNGLVTSEAKIVVEPHDIGADAEQTVTTDVSCVSPQIGNLIALVR